MNSILGCNENVRVDVLQIDPRVWTQNAKQAIRHNEDSNVYKMSPTNNVLNEKETRTRFSHIEEGLESSLSREAQSTINRIVNEVKSLSDVEKLFLYLKLPTGDSPSQDFRKTPTVGLQKPNRTQQAQTYTWIKSHLEEDELICLPKQDVYDDYRLYCETHNLKPLSTADFGKLMKSVFPNVKPRRLGQRGQSRYCYGGLRKKWDVQPPTLPELEITTNTTPGNEDDEIHTASCQLVCEWAHKLLNANFQNIRDLAEYLISNLCVNSKSVAAFTVIAAMEDAGIQNIKEPSLFSNTTGGDRHRETQMLLQRKLQEGKLLREQKKKLQQQREENEQKLKESHDRQTPCIQSPSLQQVLKSPVKRLFEEGNPTKQGKTDIQRSQSVVVVHQTKGKHERSKSIAGLDVEMVNIENEKNLALVNKKNKKKMPLNENQCEEVIPLSENRREEVFPLNENRHEDIFPSKEKEHEEITQCKINMEVIQKNSNNNAWIVDQGKENVCCKVSESESRTSDEVDGSHPLTDSVVTMEIETENTSSPVNHVIRKPSLVSANVWNNPASNKNSVVIDTDSIKHLLSTVTDIKESDCTPLISSANHSSRSAFVPFSQIQSRKDPVSELCKNPSINLTHSDGQIFITVPDNFDISKLPSSCFERIEKVEGLSQFLIVDGHAALSNGSTTHNEENITGKVAFQPVLKSGIIAPSNLVSKCQTRVTDHIMSTTAKNAGKIVSTSVRNTGNIVPQHLISSDGKLFLPTKQGGNSEIDAGEKPPSGQAAVLPPGGNITPVVNTVCSQLLKQMAQTTVISVQTIETKDKCLRKTIDISPKSVPVSNQSSVSVGTSNCQESVQSTAIPLVTRVSTPHHPVSIKQTCIPPVVISSSAISTNVTLLSCSSGSSDSLTVVNSTPTAAICSFVNTQENVDNSISNQTPPSTPKKSTKSRFAPIRPKASPVKTISSILKDTKITTSEIFVYDRSKPVSELLKEKRAREAELAIKNQQTSCVTGTSIDISSNHVNSGTKPQMCSEKTIPGSFIIPTDRNINMKNLFNVGMSPNVQSNVFLADGETLNKLQVPAGLIPVGKSGDVVYVINQVPNFSPNKSRPTSLSLYTDAEDEKKFQKQSGVESPDLNDDDTMDIEDVLKMYAEKENKVTSQTPSKLAKIEDDNQTVHSRPGSRCSADTPGGRKRKFMNNENGSFKLFGRKRLNSGDDFDEDVIVCDTLQESEENRRESRSCTFEIDSHDHTSGMISSSIKYGKQRYPDISMLEIDALIDLVQPVQPHLALQKKTVSSTGVGVNSLSLRKSQQQLLKEKPLLDERISSFLQKKDKNFSESDCFGTRSNDGPGNIEVTSLMDLDRHNSPSHQINIGEYDEDDGLQSSTGFVLPSNPALPMDDESDLPKDVADFITDVFTGVITGSEMNGEFTGSEMNGEYINIDHVNEEAFINEQNTNQHLAEPLQPETSRILTICHENFHQGGTVSQGPQEVRTASKLVERPSNIGEVNFASPQRPAGRRQRTPSVERITSQMTDRRSVPTPTLFPSPIHSAVTRRRETSIDRMTNQTPYSDPGYGSIGASPILNPTPLSQNITCDTSNNSGQNSSFMSTRADSAQSVASDAATFSPVSLASPRFQTSTPYPVRSPCPTPSRNILQSPIDGPGQSFIPIQGSQFQIDSNVTLIKPVVTVASSQVSEPSTTTQAKEQNKLRKDLIGIGSILPRNERQKPPPSYCDALLSQFQSNGRVEQTRLSGKGAFDVPTHKTEQSKSDIVENNSVLSGPFSYKLALMSTKYDDHKRTSKDLHNRSLPEHLLQRSDSHLLQNSDLHLLQDSDSKLLQDHKLFSDQEKSIQIETIKANLQNSLPHGNGMPHSSDFSSLPRGSVFIPNFIDQDLTRAQSHVKRSKKKVVHTLSDDHMLGKRVDDDIEFMAKRNLSLDLEHSTSFNEDDLETTLEDLKSLDGQYFTQDNLMDYQRQ